MKKWLLITFILLLNSVPLQAQEQENPFGVIEGFWFPELTCDLGVSWERLIFDWSQHQPTSPTDWHTLNIDDRWLKAANQCDREVVALLKATPQWATTGLVGAGVPSGLYLPVDDPDNHWANFVRQTASYYASRGVNRFIIWNEPDISRETYGFEFEGSLDDYVQMVKVAYLAAKQGNPAAKIHLAGTTYWHNVNEGEALYLERLLEALANEPDAAANKYYFDVVSLHIYFRTDTVYDIVQEVHDLLEQFDMADKAIWVNETNAPPTQDPAWPVNRPVFQYTLEQQAAFLVQAASLAYAADVERMAVYKLYDQNLPEGGETFGILRPNDQSPRPAFFAWQTVNTLFVDVQSTERYLFDNYEIVLLQRDSQPDVWVMWARTDQMVELQVEVTALASVYSYIDASEPTQQIDESMTLMLNGALCNGDDPAIPCPVGGEPIILLADMETVTIHEFGENGTMTPVLR